MERLDRVKLAASAEVDLSTVTRFLQGVAVRESSRRRIHRAAQALGLELVVAPVAHAEIRETQPTT